MNEGDVYRDLRDDIVFRVREVRGEDPDSTVAVEVLDENVETYRTVAEITEGLERGDLVPEHGVTEEDFETEDPALVLEEPEGRPGYVKVAALLLAIALLIPVAAVSAGFFLRLLFLLPALVVAGAVIAVGYYLYRWYREGGDGGLP